ncbi:MAG TPA: hypothetical protein VEZ11_12895, partial [Thermoanaerobaculia bacterium]|nr:hypothetical protein [Thermoanaerobaculia bacterium]
MLSKRVARARITGTIVGIAMVSCAGTPWRGIPRGDEVNFSFVIDNNFLRLPSITIDGRSGLYLFGSALPRSVIDTEFAGTHGQERHVLALDQRDSLDFDPAMLAIRPAADAILGADLWGDRAVTIDYHDQLITLQRNGVQT